MTTKETRISSIVMIIGFGLWFILLINSCEKVIKTKPKSTPVYSINKNNNVYLGEEQPITSPK
jgi:hypothetical protein